MTELIVDPRKTNVRIRTFAEGLFSRLAHDLELVCRRVTGTAERSGEAEGAATLEVPIGQIEVNGTLTRGVLDPRGLSPADREDALAKMQKDVFRTRDPNAVVRVEAKLEDGKARVRIVPPNGRPAEQTILVRLVREGDAAVRVSGSFLVSIQGIGGGAVKGPMNAFRVKDAVEVLFEVVFDERR